jgi:hypothetical protein
MEFYLLGDMGSGTKDQYKVSDILSRNIKQSKSKNQFVCGLGDNIYENGCSGVDDNQFNTKFEEPYSNVPDVTFYMVLGNHDYGYSNRSLDRKRNARCQIDYSDHSKKWRMDDSYYTFVEKGNGTTIGFFYIDTNLDMLTDEEIQEQFKFISERLKKSKCDWKVVVGHHTWRSIAGHGNAEQPLEEFLTGLFTTSPFDVYMCGHDHNKQVIEMDLNGKKLNLIVCGTGGKIYDDGINNYSNLDEKSSLLFCSNDLGIGKCNATKSKLLFTFLNADGEEEFSYNLLK